MLDELKWRDAKVNRDLLKLVREKNAGRDKAAVAQKSAVVRNAPEKTFPLRGANGSVQTPDGRFVIGKGEGLFTPTFDVLDVTTGQTKSFPVNGYVEAESKLEGPRLNSDGSKLIIFDRATLRIWPLKDGEPDLRKGETLLDETFQGNEEEVVRPHPIANPEWLVLEKFYAGGLFRYDLKAKTFYELPGTETVTEKLSRGRGPIFQWGVAAGTNTVVLLTPVVTNGKAKHSELRQATFTASGELGPWKTVATLPGTYETTKGKGLVAKSGYAVLRDVPKPGSVSVVSLTTGKIVDLGKAAPKKVKLESGGNLFLSPVGETLAWSSETLEGQSQVHFFDLSQPESPKFLGKTSVKGTSEAFTPDGQALLVKTAETIKMLNYSRTW